MTDSIPYFFNDHIIEIVEIINAIHVIVPSRRVEGKTVIFWPTKDYLKMVVQIVTNLLQILLQQE